MAIGISECVSSIMSFLESYYIKGVFMCSLIKVISSPALIQPTSHHPCHTCILLFLYYFCRIYCSCLICCLCFTCFSCYLRNTYLISRLCIVRRIYRLRRAYRLAFARYPCICVSLLLSLSLVAHMLIRPFPIATIASSEFYGSMLSYRVYSVLRTGCCG